MKSNELDRKVARSGAKFLYQEGTSHRYYTIKAWYSQFRCTGQKKCQQGYVTRF